MPTLEVDFGTLYPKQIELCKSEAKFTGYGGARGGGKSHVACIKAGQLALMYSGINILFTRRKFVQLEGEILPKLQELYGKVSKYNQKSGVMTFLNGSTISLKHYQSKEAHVNFQGMNYDVIFMDEATQFEEDMFNVLKLCLRLSGRVKDTSFRPRMYLTCNPGGVGHIWFKRMFIDRKYREGEIPEDYKFIPSLVFDNEYLMKYNPDYVNQLKALPEKQRQAMLYGDWNVFEGQYFDEFDETIHVFNPKDIKIEENWNVYRHRDYGLDRTACYWTALSDDGTFYVYKELGQSNLTAKQSGLKINAMTLPTEHIILDICPPDLWNRQSQTGKSVVDILIQECYQRPIKANNDFFVGCMLLKELLQVNEITGKPKLMISEDCPELINSLKMIQHDENDVNVYAKQPHDLTHSVDALRYLATSYTFRPQVDLDIFERKTNPIFEWALGLNESEKEERDIIDVGNFTEGGWFL